jgi:hypothetical protein
MSRSSIHSAPAHIPATIDRLARRVERAFARVAFGGVGDLQNHVTAMLGDVVDASVAVGSCPEWLERPPRPFHGPHAAGKMGSVRSGKPLRL